MFGSAVISVLLLTLIYAIVSGEYADRQPVASASPTPAASTAPVASTAGSASAAPTASPTPAETAVPSASGSASAVLVTIANFSFGPDLTIAAGTAVTFENSDAVKHTATNGSNGLPSSGSLFDLQLDPGASASYTFAAPGTYQVTCTIHPAMNFTITVN